MLSLLNSLFKKPSTEPFASSYPMALFGAVQLKQYDDLQTLCLHHPDQVNMGLHLAVKLRDITSVEILLDHGADPLWLTNNCYCTPSDSEKIKLVFEDHIPFHSTLDLTLESEDYDIATLLFSRVMASQWQLKILATRAPWTPSRLVFLLKLGLDPKWVFNEALPENITEAWVDYMKFRSDIDEFKPAIIDYVRRYSDESCFIFKQLFTDDSSEYNRLMEEGYPYYKELSEVWEAVSKCDFDFLKSQPLFVAFEEMIFQNDLRGIDILLSCGAKTFFEVPEMLDDTVLFLLERGVEISEENFVWLMSKPVPLYVLRMALKNMKDVSRVLDLLDEDDEDWVMVSTLTYDICKILGKI